MLIALDVQTFLQTTFPERKTLLAPWLTSQSLSLIHAWRGTGKTFLSLNIACAVASGGSFLRWHAPNASSVLLIDGEMPGNVLQERLEKIALNYETVIVPSDLRIVTPDLQKSPMPDLATQEGQSALNDVLGDSRLIILDNLSCLCRGSGRENDAESWSSISTWALRMRQEGRAVLFIHHSGKNGMQRGTSKKEDILDNTICLKRPSDYQTKEGARFEVHFEKSRGLCGSDILPFEAMLQQDGVWSIKEVEVATANRVLELKRLGMSVSEITGELGIHRVTVYRALKNAKEGGT